MHIPNDAFERMSRGMRDGLKAKTDDGRFVPKDMWNQVETIMNEQGLGWCDKHMCWHTVDELTMQEFVPPYHGCKRFRDIERLDELIAGKLGEAQYSPGSSYAITNAREHQRRVEEHRRQEFEKKIQQLGRLRAQRQTEEEREIREMIERLGQNPGPVAEALKKAAQSQQEALKKKREAEQQNEKIGKIIEEAWQKSREQKKREQEEERQRKEKPPEEKAKKEKWLHKTYNQCPDCKMETVTHERRLPPMPDDPCDRILYTRISCGCKTLREVGIF